MGWKYRRIEGEEEEEETRRWQGQRETDNEINSTHGGCFCGRRKIATKLAVPNCTSLRMDPAGWLVGWFVRWTRRQSPALVSS